MELTALRKDLRASTAEGTATSVMVGIGETYLPAFVLAVSANQLACGLVSTVPLLAGAVLQLISPRMVRQQGAYRRWVVCCAAIQAVAFVPLLVGAMWGFIPVVAVFGLATVYWAGGMASGAAWNAWVETLVPQRLQARYFARRALVSQWGVMAGFVVGGLVLHAAGKGAARCGPLPCSFWWRPPPASSPPPCCGGNGNRSRRESGSSCRRWGN